MALEQRGDADFDSFDRKVRQGGHDKCRVPRDSEHWISESYLAIDRRGDLPGGQDGQTESVERGEALPDRQRGAEPKRANWTDRQTASGFRRIDLSVAG